MDKTSWVLSLQFEAILVPLNFIYDGWFTLFAL